MCPTLRFTYEDYLQLPENCRYEIVDGDPFMVPAPTPNHQRVSRKLGRFLDDYVTERNLGEVFHAPCDLLLSDFDVVQPDIEGREPVRGAKRHAIAASANTTNADAINQYRALERMCSSGTRSATIASGSIGFSGSSTW